MTRHPLRPLLVAVLLGVLLPNGSSGQAAAAPPSATTTVTPPYASSETWTDPTSCALDAAWYGFPFFRKCVPLAAADHRTGTLSASVLADTGLTPDPCKWPGPHGCPGYAWNQQLAARASIVAKLPHSGTVRLELDIASWEKHYWSPESNSWMSMLKLVLEQGRGKPLATINLLGPRSGPLVVTVPNASSQPLKISLQAYKTFPGGPWEAVSGTARIRSISVS